MSRMNAPNAAKPFVIGWPPLLRSEVGIHPDRAPTWDNASRVVFPESLATQGLSL